MHVHTFTHVHIIIHVHVQILMHIRGQEGVEFTRSNIASSLFYNLSSICGGGCGRPMGLFIYYIMVENLPDNSILQSGRTHCIFPLC